MKKYFALILILFSVISCTKKGEGKISDREIPLSLDLRTIEARGDFRLVILLDENNPRMVIETYENLVNNLDIKNSNNSLIIKQKNPVSEADIYNIHLYVPNINKIELEESVQAEANAQFRNEKFEINLKNETKFLGNDMISNETEIKAEDNSKINIKGKAKKLKLKLHDNSNFSGLFYEVSEADCNLSDLSLAEINVKEKLTGIVNDESSLKYVGEPIKDIKQKDLGEIKQKK